MIAYTKLQTFVLSTAVFLGANWREPCRAQEAAKPDDKAATKLESVADIEGLYRKELDDIERRRLERLATLAGKQTRDEANHTYETYFRAAIAANLFADAEPVADRVVRSKDASSQVVLLADVVRIMAQVGRGAYEESLKTLTAALDATDNARAAPHRALPVPAQLTLLDAYFQRLTQGEQYAIARRAFALVRDRTSDPEIKAFAAARLSRLDLVGKPAPPLAGTDVDGRPVRLADFHGNVVLVVFWATWCLDCAEEASRLNAVYAGYRDRGFRIVGINLDSLQAGRKSVDAVRPAVRQFLLEYNVGWPNLINGPDDQDYARAYAVGEIPANVLISRDGTVIQLDLARSNLEKAVARAVAQ